MINRLFKRKPTVGTPHQIYGGLMTHARNRVFYEHFGVPDSVMGRFDMLAMHVYMLTRRLAQENKPVARELSQDVFDLFVGDIERALRQIGIGDTTVPKRKKRLVHSFYAQIEDFDPLLETSDKSELANSVARRYFKDAENGNPSALADYMIETANHLNQISLDKFLAGKSDWLAPK